MSESITIATIANAQIAAARIEETYPTTVRFAIYPNGERKLQGAFKWTQGFSGGFEWRDIEAVDVDENEAEIANDK